MRGNCNIIVIFCEQAKFWNKKMSEIRKLVLDILAHFVYYMQVGSEPTAHGEVA